MKAGLEQRIRGEGSIKLAGSQDRWKSENLTAASDPPTAPQAQAGGIYPACSPGLCGLRRALNAYLSSHQSIPCLFSCVSVALKSRS